MSAGKTCYFFILAVVENETARKGHATSAMRGETYGAFLDQ